MADFLSPKQLDFCIGASRKWNIAHGSVRSGKTVGTTFSFLNDAFHWPDSNIYMFGHTSKTIFRNVIRLIFEDPTLRIFKPFCSWHNGILTVKDKKITVLGAEDEGSVAKIQGLSISLAYCDEMTLYPDSVINMIDTRLSFPHSKGYASMNPSYPDHTLKKWIDMGENGDKNYYSLHFTLDDNPYLDQDYKDRIKNSLSGLFYKRNYLGLWVLADGAIFEFFDTDIHVISRPPCAAEYWIAGIDVGSVNPFACLLIGVNSGKSTQSKPKIWVEKEYFWCPKQMQRQKTHGEFAEDVQNFLKDYAIKNIYIDPSAEAFQLELRKKGMHCVHANNDVKYGIDLMTSSMFQQQLYVLKDCKNLIREIQSYVWDSKEAKKGYDEPLKKDDHAVDALRYAIATHKVATYKADSQDPKKNEIIRESRYYGFR